MRARSFFSLALGLLLLAAAFRNQVSTASADGSTVVPVDITYFQSLAWAIDSGGDVYRKCSLCTPAPQVWRYDSSLPAGASTPIAIDTDGARAWVLTETGDVYFADVPVTLPLQWVPHGNIYESVSVNVEQSTTGEVKNLYR